MKEWNEKDLNLFKRLYPKEDLIELTALFGRSKGSLLCKASKLKIKKEIKADGSRPFSEEEINFLINNYSSMSCLEMSKELNRTISTIKTMASHLKLKNNFWWTNDEIQFLYDNFSEGNKNYLCDSLNKNWKAIGKKARELGLNRIKKDGTKFEANKLANKKELDFIIKNYDKMTSIEISRQLNRSILFVELNCNKLGLSIFKQRKNPNDYTNENLLEMLKDLSNELKRTPYLKDLRCNDQFPSPDIYYDRFGSFINALMLADIKMETNSIYGKRCLSENNEICLSISEKIITDFLFLNNIQYEKEVPYKLLIPNINKKYTMDWLLFDNSVVEFFGLMKNEKYSKRAIKKIKICHQNNLKLIEIYDKDIDNLSEIFKEYIL